MPNLDTTASCRFLRTDKKTATGKFWPLWGRDAQCKRGFYVLVDYMKELHLLQPRLLCISASTEDGEAVKLKLLVQRTIMNSLEHYTTFSSCFTDEWQYYRLHEGASCGVRKLHARAFAFACNKDQAMAGKAKSCLVNVSNNKPSPPQTSISLVTTCRGSTSSRLEARCGGHAFRSIRQRS